MTTGYQIVKRTLAVLGLPVPNTIAGSPDALNIQIWALATEVGQELVGKHTWQFLNRTYEFDTVPGQLQYDLPADFNRLIADTGWNTATNLPILGPANDEQWAALSYDSMAKATFRTIFRMNGNKIQLQTVPEEPQRLAIAYRSNGWAQAATDPTVFRNWLEDDGDSILFGDQLFASFLRLKWRETKGFDSSAAERDYNNALSAAKNADSPGQSINITARRGSGLIGLGNLPETGYGL
jgi:hypothetical protein